MRDTRAFPKENGPKQRGCSERRSAGEHRHPLLLFSILLLLLCTLATLLAGNSGALDPPATPPHRPAPL